MRVLRQCLHEDFKSAYNLQPLPLLGMSISLKNLSKFHLRGRGMGASHGFSQHFVVSDFTGPLL